jgi:DNA-binding MarR family transcriptional regulator
MPEELRERIKQTKPFESLGQKATVSLLVAASAVKGKLNKIHSQHDIFGSQYNILRILAGGPPEGYPRCEIIERMINRGPDVTRLVDPLEARGLIERARSEEDRRVVLHRITEKGEDLLEKISPSLASVHDVLGEELSDNELQEFSRLCAIIYQRFDETEC